MGRCGRAWSEMLYRGNCFYQSTASYKHSGTILCYDYILYRHSEISRMSLNALFLFGKCYLKSAQVVLSARPLQIKVT